MHPNAVNIRRAIFALLGLLVIVQLVPGLMPSLGGEDWPYVVIGLMAAGLTFWRAATVRTERLAWSLIGFSLLFWSAGDVAWAIVWHDGTAPDPNISDLLYLLSYPLSFGGLIVLLRARVHGTRTWEWLDAVTGGLALSALAAALLYGSLISNVDGPALSALVATAYPVMDLATLCLVVVAIGSSGWRIDRTWAMLGGGYALTAISDGLYSYSEFHGATWGTGTEATAIAAAAMILTAAAAWQPRSAQEPSREGMASIFVPALATLLSLSLLISGAATSGAMPIVVLLLASGAMLVAGIRSALTFRDNLELLRDSRLEALTDNLSGLGNRRALMEALELRLAEGARSQAATLVFFDLDGFKGYNDAFGHSAGDALLVRLGRSLRSEVGRSGVAYRPGGDEFCVIFDGHHSRHDRLVSATSEALSEQGDGFEIRASFGVVHLPLEADTPTSAMNLVDERMYDDKGDRRRTARSQARDLLLQLLHEREPELETHVGVVASHTVATGRRLGISGDELDELARGAELHDLGKVSIPDSILHKPGPLDDNEWRLMHQHTIVGERILAAVPSLQPVAKLVRSSHERWDGGGYPDGLVADAIPLGARIIAACDAFDAMVSSRPYANAISTEVAIEELERCAGAQFDPDVVVACVAAIRSGELDAQRELDLADRG